MKICYSKTLVKYSQTSIKRSSVKRSPSIRNMCSPFGLPN